MSKVYIIFFCLIVTAIGYADQQYQDVALVNLYHNNLDFFDSFLSPSEIDGLEYSTENLPSETIQTLRRAWNSYSSMRGRLLSWCVEVNNTADSPAENINLLLNRDDFVTKMIRGINEMKKYFDLIATNDNTPNMNSKKQTSHSEAIVNGNIPPTSRNTIEVTAGSEFSTSTSTSQTMQPLQLPILVTIREPAVQIVPLGTTVQYNCRAKSLFNYRVSIWWIKEGGALPLARSVDDGDGNLVIINASSADSGTYSCIAYDSRSYITQKVQFTVGEQNPHPGFTIHLAENYSQTKPEHLENFVKNSNIQDPNIRVQKRHAYGTKNPSKTFEDKMKHAKNLIDNAFEIIRVIYNDNNKNFDIKESVWSCKSVLNKLAAPSVEPPQYTLPSQKVLPSSEETLRIALKSCSKVLQIPLIHNEKECEAILSKSTMERFVKMYRFEKSVADFFNAIDSAGSARECKDEMQSFITNSYMSWAYEVPKMESTQYMKISICLNSDRNAQVTIVN